MSQFVVQHLLQGQHVISDWLSLVVALIYSSSFSKTYQLGLVCVGTILDQSTVARPPINQSTHLKNEYSRIDLFCYSTGPFIQLTMVSV